MARHNPGTSRLHFGGNPDVNSDPGISEVILQLGYWQWRRLLIA